MASTDEQEPGDERAETSSVRSTWNEDAVAGEGVSIYSDDPDIQEAYQVQQLVEKRFDHKAMLTELNVRLAKFVAQCRDLEANNRILVAQLEAGKLGLSTAIVTLGARLQLELEEIKGLIVSSQTCRLELTQRLDLLEEYYERKQTELEQLELGGRGEKAQKERLEEQVSVMEEEVMCLRERVAEYDDAVRKSEEDIIARLQQEEQELHKALAAEHAATQAARRQRETLHQDMLEMRQQHLINKSEITVIGNESSEEKRRAWRSKFAGALRQLHDDYMARLDQVHLEAERTFSEKLAERSGEESDRSAASGIVSQLAAVNVRSAAQVDRLSSRIADLTARVAQKEAELEALQKERSASGSEHKERQKELREELRGAKAELEKSKLQVARTIREKVSLSKEVESYRSVVESLRAQVQQKVEEPEMDDCAECERLRRIKSETSLRQDDTLCDSLLSSFHSQGGMYSAPKTPSHAVTQSCGLVMSIGSAASEAEPSYRSSEALHSSYRGSAAQERSHRGSTAQERSHRSSEALKSSRRSSKSAKPSFRTAQNVQQTYRSSKTVQPTYRTSKTIQPTYRGGSLPRGSFDMQGQEDFSFGTNMVRSLGAGGSTRSWSRGGRVIY